MGGLREESLGEGADGFTWALFVLNRIGEQLSPRSACLGRVHMAGLGEQAASLHTVPRAWELVAGPQGMLIWTLLMPFGMSGVGWDGTGLEALRGLWGLEGDLPVRKGHLIQPGGEKARNICPWHDPHSCPSLPRAVLVREEGPSGSFGCRSWENILGQERGL